MLNEETHRKLTEMKLNAMAQALVELEREAPSNQRSFSEKLGYLVDQEWMARENRRLTRLLRAAKLTHDAALEDVWTMAGRGVTKAQVRDLATCNWVEHRHNVSVEGPPKMESWHVRHGCIHTFGEGEPTLDLPCRLPESQLKVGGITVRHCTTYETGEVGTLNRQTARHFMIAGSEGAIVTEYGTPHYDDALEFTNSSVVF